MDTAVDSYELREGIHELLRAREESINHLRAQHNTTLRELYRYISRPSASGSSFPNVELDASGSEDGFEAWRTSHSLGLGETGSVTSLVLPALPPFSPPPGITVFPDEVSASTTAPAAIPSASISNKRAISPSSPSHPGPSEPAPKRPRVKNPQMMTPPPDSPPLPPLFVDPRDLFSRPSFERVAELDAPEWIPLDTYFPAASPPKTPPSIPMPLVTAYTSALPPLPPIPAQQPNRRQKKKDDKQGITKLYAQFAVNPLSDAMSKSSKCVLTSDWRVAMQELRHIRAMERIEAKKAEGRWSLRQPKKGRGVPVLKSHWDYLLEEMQWLKEDFAEERRWKRLVALELAYQIVEWHLASPGEKAERMVGGRGWGAAREAVPGRSADRAPPKIRNVSPDPIEEDIDMSEANGQAGEVLDEIIQKKEDEEVEKAQKEKDAKTAIMPTASKPSSEKSSTPNPVRKVSIAKDSTAVESTGSADAEGEADADGEADAEGEADADGEVDDTSATGVIGLSDIPAPQPTAKPAVTVPEGDDKLVQANPTRTDTVLPNGMILNKRFKTVEELIVARKPLLGLSLTEAFVDLESLPFPDSLPSSSKVESFETPFPTLLTDLFPDLGVYDGPHPPVEGKSAKRLDEGYTSGHKIAHTSRLMDIRPVFVSTLKPCESAESGHWDLAVGPYYEDPRGSTLVGPEVLATTSSIFIGRGIRPPNASHVPMQPTPQGQHLRTPLVWSDEEEKVLVRLITTYPYNWALIADSFNSDIIVIPTEKRTAYDCWEKWHYKWGPGKGQQPPGSAQSSASGTNPPPSAGPPSSNLTPLPPVSAVSGSSATPSAAAGPSKPAKTPVLTPGGIAVPTLPPSSAGGEANGEGPPPPGLSKREARAAKNKYEGSKKAIRHQVLYDSMRRVNRRREQSKQKANQQAPRVINVHESHATYPMAQIATPMDLVDMKYARDMANLRARQQRIVQEQHARQEVARQQQQLQHSAAQQIQNQHLLAAQQQQQAMRNGGTPNGRVGPIPGPGQTVPNMVTPSQQQLLSAVAAANAVHSRQGSANNSQAGNSSSPSIRSLPTPQQQAQLLASGQTQGPVLSTATQSAHMNQQIAHLTAQTLSAQQAVQTNAHSRAQSNPNSTNSASPYAPPGLDLPNAGSPVMHPNSSPQLQAGMRGPNMTLAQASHLRLSSNGSQGSPQMSNSPSIPPPMGQPQQQTMDPAIYNMLVAKIQAQGGTATNETVRSMHAQLVRQQHVQAQAHAQAQAMAAQGIQQNGIPQMGQAPQGGMQNPAYARSPSVQAMQQAAARASPKPSN